MSSIKKSNKPDSTTVEFWIKWLRQEIKDENEILYSWRKDTMSEQELIALTEACNKIGATIQGNKVVRICL